MDPQGSGPDTHYKVLQAIARAVEAWSKEEDLSKLRIIGYRNVWFKYNPWDAEVIVPVSLNALATLDKSFSECYVTQVNASFPSYQLDGKFSELTQRVWFEQRYFPYPVAVGGPALKLDGVFHFNGLKKRAHMQRQAPVALCLAVIKPHDGIAQGLPILIKADRGRADG